VQRDVVWRHLCKTEWEVINRANEANETWNSFYTRCFSFNTYWEGRCAQSGSHIPYPMVAYFEQRNTGNFYWPCFKTRMGVRLCKGKTIFSGNYSPKTKVWDMRETTIICGANLGPGVYKLFPFCNSFLGYWNWDKGNSDRNFIYLVMKDVSYSLHVFEPYLKSVCDMVTLRWEGDAYYSEHQQPQPIALTITAIIPVSPDPNACIPEPDPDGTTGVILANIKAFVNYYNNSNPILVEGTSQISGIPEFHKQGLVSPYAEECDLQAPKLLVLSATQGQTMNILAEIRGDFLFGYWNDNMTFRMRYPRKYEVVIADLYKN